MGGWTDGRTDGRADGRADGQADGRTDGGGRTDGRAGGRADKQTGKLMGVIKSRLQVRFICLLRRFRLFPNCLANLSQCVNAHTQKIHKAAYHAIS